MAPLFEELDSQSTPLGEISLRRRAELRLNGEVLYEVKLGDEFLMSSLFTEAEIQLAHLGIAALASEGMNHELTIIVGGLGLGYTALAALEHDQVGRLDVVDIMPAVIDWHKRGLVPIGDSLFQDNRCTLIEGDFFAMAGAADQGFISTSPKQQVHAVLLDIDHSPSRWLNAGNSKFYTRESLLRLAGKILPGGVFGLWSDDLPDPAFITILEQVFARCNAEVVRFPNPYTGEDSTNSVYIAHTAQ